MHLIEIGQQLRQLRYEAGYSQAQLAQLAGLARETVNRIEKGTYNDLGVKKLLTLFSLVGGALVVQKAARQVPNYVARAVSTANVSHAGRLHADELIQALVTGNVPPGREGHLQAALQELSEANVKGLIDQVGELSGNPQKVARGAARLKSRLGIASAHP